MTKRLLQAVVKRLPKAVVIIMTSVVIGYLITASPPSPGRMPGEAGIVRLAAPSNSGADPSPGPASYGFSAGELVWMSPSQRAKQLDDMKATGIGWVRIDMEWYVVQPSNAQTFDWSAYDQTIDDIQAHGLSALVILDYAPAWAAASGCRLAPSHKCAPADPGAFAAFAAAAASRYTSHGVTSWEIWNEPNTQRFWYPKPNPDSYAELLKATYPAIKRVNPSATVVTAGLASNASSRTISPADYIGSLYAAGAKPYFDALGAHPYSYPLLPSDAVDNSGWTQMLEIHNIAASKGDATKKIWMTEVGASTGGPHPVSERLQTQIAEQVISLRNSYSWAGPLFWYDYQDLGTDRTTNEDFFGLVRADGSHKPAYGAFVLAVKMVGI